MANAKTNDAEYYWLANVGTGNGNGQGPKGDPGPPGPKGDPGANGFNGMNGVNATIEIGSIVTGAPGSDADVYNSGDASAVILNFLIPEGPQGPQGPAGINVSPGNRGRCWHDEALVLNGSAPMQLTAGGGFLFIGSQVPAAQNDSFQNSILIEPGTYTFFVFGQAGPDRGICNWSIDGVTIGFTDFYAASTSTVFRVIPNITLVPSPNSLHTIIGTVSTKNPASTGYVMTLAKYSFRPPNND